MLLLFFGELSAVLRRIRGFLLHCVSLAFCLLQASVSSLQTLLTRYVDSLVCLTLVCWDMVVLLFVTSCVSIVVRFPDLKFSSHAAVFQHSGEQSRQSVCAADHSKVSTTVHVVLFSYLYTHCMQAVHPPFKTQTSYFDHLHVFKLISQFDFMFSGFFFF